MNGMMNAFFVASSVWIPSLRSLTFAAICDTASLNSMIIALLLFLSVWLLLPWRFRLKFLVLVLIRGQIVQIGIRRDIIGKLLIGATGALSDALRIFHKLYDCDPKCLG